MWELKVKTGKNNKTCQQGEKGECVSLFSDSASVASGVRMLRMKILHKYFSFSMPKDLKLLRSLLYFLLADINPLISFWLGLVFV